MKRYLIKYEDHSGNCWCEEIQAHSEQHAKSRLSHDCKIVYWCKIKK